MNDLKSAVSDAFANVVASGAIEQAIEKQLADTISQVIRDRLRAHSDFGKAIEAKVQQAESVNLDRMNLPSYNDLILQIIRRQVDGVMQSEAAQQLEENMAKLLEPAPPQIEFEKLLEEFINQHKEGHEGEGFSLHIENKWGSTYICLDKESGKSEYQCDYRIGVGSDGKVYHLAFGGKEVQKTIFMGPFYGFERTLFQLYAAKCVLTIPANAQPHDFETSFPYRD